MNLDSKNLGIPFGPGEWVLCRAGTQSCKSIPEQRCFSACFWWPTLLQLWTVSRWGPIAALVTIPWQCWRDQLWVWTAGICWVKLHSETDRDGVTVGRRMCQRQIPGREGYFWNTLRKRMAWLPTLHQSVVLRDIVSRVVSPSSLITKNKYLLVKADLFLFRLLYFCTITLLQNWFFQNILSTTFIILQNP